MVRYPVLDVRFPPWSRVVLAVLAGSVASAAVAEPVLGGQQAGVDRLPAEVLDAAPPSARVTGAPGAMAIRDRECRAFPPDAIRRRIIELAVQEWGYFGFAVVDRTDEGDEDDDGRRWRGRRRGADDGHSARVASSIAGYWAVTPDGAWILDSQNAIWGRPDGASSRWRFAWSAAFVSWVMCESGLATAAEFSRAVAHHAYIDQAIRARDGREPRAAFAAYEAGETDIAPGDLLCTARRPAYGTVAARRRQMGEGARTHCDIVVKVDEDAGRVFAIGGNVRGTVGLKALPAVRADGVLRIGNPDADRGARGIFAHLKLGAAYRAADAFDASPAVRALGCAGGAGLPAWRTAAALVAAEGADCAG
jgi:hypothetical protein